MSENINEKWISIEEAAEHLGIIHYDCSFDLDIRLLFSMH